MEEKINGYKQAIERAEKLREELWVELRAAGYKEDILRPALLEFYSQDQFKIVNEIILTMNRTKDYKTEIKRLENKLASIK